MPLLGRVGAGKSRRTCGSSAKVLARVLAVLALALSRPASGRASDVFFADYGGKGQHAVLDIEESWPLTEFARNEPYLGPDDALEGGTARLLWRRLPKMAAVTRVGPVAGVAVYRITYSPVDQGEPDSPVSSVFVWNTGGWMFRPVLMIWGDPSNVAWIYEPEVFQWKGTAIVHVRVQITGTGNLQESHFLATVDGAIVPLRPDMDALFRHLKEKKLGFYHRGGGFCQNSLRFRAGLVSEEGPSGMVGSLSATFKIVGKALVFDSIRTFTDSGGREQTTAELPPCELYPR